jgi:hypothetical protein
MLSNYFRSVHELEKKKRRPHAGFGKFLVASYTYKSYFQVPADADPDSIRVVYGTLHYASADTGEYKQKVRTNMMLGAGAIFSTVIISEHIYTLTLSHTLTHTHTHTYRAPTPVARAAAKCQRSPTIWNTTNQTPTSMMEATTRSERKAVAAASVVV